MTNKRAARLAWPQTGRWAWRSAWCGKPKRTDGDMTMDSRVEGE